MRIAILSTSYPASPGDPSGHFVQAEARQLARDADVHVFTTGARSPAVRGDDGVTVWRGGGSAFGWPGVVARVRENPLRIASVVTWCARVRAEVARSARFARVIAHWAIPSALVAVTIDAPLTIVSHGADVRLLAAVPSPMRRALLRPLLHRASTWRFVSASLRETFIASLTHEERTRLDAIAVVAASPIELPDVSAAIAQHRSTRDVEHLVVCVGRLVPGKRFDRALDHVARSAPARTRVVVVGDGPERGRLERHARTLGIDARFVGLASRESTLAWIGAADRLLHASRDEGLSTVVREAEALGVKVEIVA